jgi:glycosyltransferase involved in cell wall biosynthesis
MRILALTKYSELAASTRQRFAQFAPYLRENGIDLEIAPLLPDAHLKALSGERGGRRGLPAAYFKRLATLVTRRDFDLLWVQYELFPYFPGWMERLAALPGVPIVCDYDDAIFHMYDDHPGRFRRRMLGGKLEPLLARSAAAVCGNQYLQDYASRFCPRTMLVPTVVDATAYVPPPPGQQRVGGPRVGWLGSPSTWVNVEPVLESVLGALAPFGGRFRAIGAGKSAAPRPGVEFIDWDRASEIAELQQLDVGIMPLIDRPFQRGKCGYKLIQYMACGVPVVASPVGVNREIVVHGENGFLASTEAEWRDAIRRLLADPPLRQLMGAAGRRRVEELYSLQVQQPRLLDLFRSVG